MAQQFSLEVHQHEKEDVYRDRIRIPVIHRGTIGEGRVAKLSVNGKTTLIEVRGLLRETRAIIRLDELTRSKLGGLQEQTSYSFHLREVWWCGQFKWAWQASDPTARLAARLGLIGVILGIIGIVPLLKDLLKYISN